MNHDRNSDDKVQSTKFSKILWYIGIAIEQSAFYWMFLNNILGPFWVGDSFFVYLVNQKVPVTKETQNLKWLLLVRFMYKSIRFIFRCLALHIFFNICRYLVVFEQWNLNWAILWIFMYWLSLIAVGTPYKLDSLSYNINNLLRIYCFRILWQASPCSTFTAQDCAR